MESRRGREFTVDGKKEGKGVCCEWKAEREGSILWMERRKGREFIVNGKKEGEEVYCG